MQGMNRHWVLKPHGCATPQTEDFVFNYTLMLTTSQRAKGFYMVQFEAAT